MLMLSLPHVPLREQARQLESLARLAEARARVELRQVVTREDAEVSREVHVRMQGIEKAILSICWTCPD